MCCILGFRISSTALRSEIIEGVASSSPAAGLLDNLLNVALLNYMYTATIASEVVWNLFNESQLVSNDNSVSLKYEQDN